MMRNPGLLDEMAYLHIVTTSSEETRRCIHCDAQDVSSDSRCYSCRSSFEAICSLCKATFFFNPKLENAYKYCDVCHDFHYFMFFLADDGQSFLPECVVSSIPVRPSFGRFLCSIVTLRCHCVLYPSLQTEAPILGRCDGCLAIPRHSRTSKGSLHALWVSLVLPERFRVLPSLSQSFLFRHSSLHHSFSETSSSDQPTTINLLLVRNVRNVPLAGVSFRLSFHFDRFVLHTRNHFSRDVISAKPNKQASPQCPFHLFQQTKPRCCINSPIASFYLTWKPLCTFCRISAGISATVSAAIARCV